MKRLTKFSGHTRKAQRAKAEAKAKRRREEREGNEEIFIPSSYRLLKVTTTFMKKSYPQNGTKWAKKDKKGLALVLNRCIMILSNN
jgi:hypothetical protein